MISLTLYHRQGCHLCEEMFAALGQLQSLLDFEVIGVEIDSDTALYRRFKDKIPVLALGDEIICCHRLDGRALQQALTDG